MKRSSWSPSGPLPSSRGLDSLDVSASEADTVSKCVNCRLRAHISFTYRRLRLHQLHAAVTQRPPGSGWFRTSNADSEVYALPKPRPNDTFASIEDRCTTDV